jgi:hypothetical protein
MLPKKAKSKPSIDQALMEWRVVFAGVLQTIYDSQEVDSEYGERNNTAVEVAAQVAAEIWKGVDHGDDA